MWCVEQVGASREQDPKHTARRGGPRKGGEDKPRPRASQEATVTLNVDGNSSRGQRASGGG